MAYEGAAELSPFTEVLIKHMEAVDLPISNLMHRVRQEVLNVTNGKQRTWDHSSLMQPFFFNPWSLFLFMGNLVALISLPLSLIPYSSLLSTPGQPWEHLALSACLPLISLSILVFGVQTMYSRLRGRFVDNPDRIPTVKTHVIECAIKGAFGGYLGALVAAHTVSVLYYREWSRLSWALQPPEPLGRITLEVTIAAALLACILGFLTLYFARIT